MASIAPTLSARPTPTSVLRSIATILAGFLDRLRLNGQDCDYYGHMLREGLADDAATLMQMI
ncbi:hypothetical protein [Novosphingobium gossypii]|uniref:hypothetical protein n=1 Tax=Novosphingobium gossypii TaxID=1604774 RepID=UPI003D23CD05